MTEKIHPVLLRRRKMMYVNLNQDPAFTMETMLELASWVIGWGDLDLYLGVGERYKQTPEGKQGLPILGSGSISTTAVRKHHHYTSKARAARFRSLLRRLRSALKRGVDRESIIEGYLKQYPKLPTE